MRKYLYIAAVVLILAGMGLWTYRASADSEGANSPSASGNDATVGIADWFNIGDIFASDSIYATSTTKSCNGDSQENSVKIIKGGAISGTDKSTGALLPTTEAYVSYGGSSDLWGTTWTPSDINSSTFGVGFSVVVNGASPTIMHYLTATGFGFSIPAGATINGILVEIEEQRVGTGSACI